MDRKKHRQRGADLIEFTFTLLPLLAILFVLVDISWAIFAKSTLMFAVRTGVRQGITITGTQATAANQTLTQMVKATVEAKSLGLLRGTTGLSYIKVNYFAQSSSSSTGVADVSTQSNGNAPGNIMQVSVINYPLPGLTPRIYSWLAKADNSPANLSAISADRIEPSGDVPPIGTAP